MAAYRRSLANNRPSHFELLELPATVLGFLRPIVYQRILDQLRSAVPQAQACRGTLSVAQRRGALDFAQLLQDDSIHIEILYQI
jgi:hypothetical protein